MRKIIKSSFQEIMRQTFLVSNVMANFRPLDFDMMCRIDSKILDLPVERLGLTEIPWYYDHRKVEKFVKELDPKHEFNNYHFFRMLQWLEHLRGIETDPKYDDPLLKYNNFSNGSENYYRLTGKPKIKTDPH